MAPIHDTDVGEERWLRSEWENYELWEKLELRLKRQKRLWIFCTFITFMVLSAVPILMDRWPKWKTRSVVRNLAQHINQLKKHAAIQRAPLRFTLTQPAEGKFLIEKVTHCSQSLGSEVIQSGSLWNESSSAQVTFLTPEQGEALGVPGLTRSFCYEPLLGASVSGPSDFIQGFAVMPVTDLTERRMDRLSVLLLSGILAEATFE
ncbi:MAG: hypothetical protein ACO3A2_07700 [Bdellovibrionia bacterium]